MFGYCNIFANIALTYPFGSPSGVCYMAVSPNSFTRFYWGKVAQNCLAHLYILYSPAVIFI